MRITYIRTELCGIRNNPIRFHYICYAIRSPAGVYSVASYRIRSRENSTSDNECLDVPRDHSTLPFQHRDDGKERCALLRGGGGRGRGDY